MCSEPGGTPADPDEVSAGGRAAKVHDDDCRCHDCFRTEDPEPDWIVLGIDPDCCGCGAELVVLRGYLDIDRGGEPGFWRLYLSLAKNEHLEIRDRDIVGRKSAGVGSLVWVCSDARLRHVRTRSARQIQHDLFEGPIVRRRTVEGDEGDGGGYEGGYPVADPTSFGCPASVRYTRCH